ncbi:MAG TPA: hypothetical protein VFW11_12410 [Cyclobacteriaceae bacterium]|nr:hypothetical protein [Cyclobacteriaceae bacterium]
MNVRKIELNEMKVAHFSKRDVLEDEGARMERIHKLLKAVVLSHLEHQDVGIVIKLESDELIETYCNLIDFAGDYVMIKGGTIIPLISIAEIEF